MLKSYQCLEAIINNKPSTHIIKANHLKKKDFIKIAFTFSIVKKFSVLETKKK